MTNNQIFQDKMNKTCLISILQHNELLLMNSLKKLLWLKIKIRPSYAAIISSSGLVFDTAISLIFLFIISASLVISDFTLISLLTDSCWKSRQSSWWGKFRNQSRVVVIEKITIEETLILLDSQISPYSKCPDPSRFTLGYIGPKKSFIFNLNKQFLV